MIRGARPGDVDAIAELYGRSFRTLSFLPALHTLAEHRAWFGEVVAQRKVWVWEEDRAILGFVGLGDDTQNETARRFYERHGLRLTRLTDGEGGTRNGRRTRSTPGGSVGPRSDRLASR